MVPTQSWVGYAARSYEIIKRSLLNRLGITAPEITDHSETNPFIILISQFSGVGEIIHLYLDAIARESFLGTARRFSSVVKLVKLIDYNIKAGIGASVDLQFILVNNVGVPTATSVNILIPKNTLIYPVNSVVPFRVLADTTLKAGLTSIRVAAEQFTQFTNQVLGTTSVSSAPSQAFTLPGKYVDKSLKVIIAGTKWNIYKSFGLMGPTTKGAVVIINENREINLVFGDGVNGQIPPDSQNIYVDYKESEGSLGNLPPQSITQLQTTFTLPDSLVWQVTNRDYSSNGTDVEGIDEIRDNAPRSIRTLDRAVTYQDYVDLAKMVTGVGAAEVKYCCGKFVDVYVVPVGKGVATSVLVKRVKSQMDCQVMITTKLDVKPAGTSRIYVKARIIGKPLAQAQDIEKDVLNAWDENFGVGNIQINRRVSVTDIIAVTEALDKVDTVEIQEIRIEPYVRPVNNTQSTMEMVWDYLPHTTVKYPYRLVYSADLNLFQVYRNGGFLFYMGINSPTSDGDLITFKILPGNFADKDTFEFTIHPSYPEIFPESLINVTDFSAPVIDISPFINDNTARELLLGEITIEEQGSNSSCMPSCN